jgi:hypothetical protein
MKTISKSREQITPNRRRIPRMANSRTVNRRATSLTKRTTLRKPNKTPARTKNTKKWATKMQKETPLKTTKRRSNRKAKQI